MSEIVCRSCGARNPSQSKYCNKCGASLRSGTSQICPGCEKSNPIELLYCDHCGTLLAEDALLDDPQADEDEEPAPDNRSKPFSLPTRPPGQTGNLDVSGEIPGWLKTGDVDAETDSVHIENTPDEENAPGREDAPDWLEAAQASDEWEDAGAPTLDELSGSHTPSDDLPTWLLEDEAGDAIFNSEKDTNELFNEGTARRREVEAEEMAAQTPETPEELPDWLDGLSPAGTGPLPFVSDEADERATDAGEEASVAGSGADAATEATSELQGWLSAMEEDESAPDEPATEGEPAADDDDFARWLTGEEFDDAGTGTEGVQSLDEEGFRHWLADAQQEEADFEGAGAEGAAHADTPERESPEADGAADDDAPDWLAMPEEDLLAAEDDVTSSESDDSEAPPDWLAEFDEAGPESIDEPRPDAEDAQWAPLADAVFPDEEPQDDAPPVEEDAVGEEMTEEDFMAWLATLDEGGAAGAPDAEEVPAVSEEEEPDDLFLPEDGVEEVADPADSQEEPSPIERSEQMTDEEDAAEAPAELPSWLGELGQSDEELAGAEGEIDSDLPEWLQSLPGAQETGQLPYLESQEEEAELEGEREIEVEAEEQDLDAAPDAEAATEAEQDDQDVPEWLAGVSPEFDLANETAVESDAIQEEPEQPTQAAEGGEGRRQEQEEAAFDELDLAEASLDSDTADRLVRTEDLPDWFSDVMADIETESEVEGETAGTGELPNVPPQLAANELPEWLDSPFADAQDAELTPLEEIPEWLQPPPGADQDSLAPDEELLDLGVRESSDEWADLLDALPPPEKESQGLSQADIPEWLQALKPQALRDDSEEVPAQTEPEETEGPLAGLRGVIGVAPAMAHPRLAERTDVSLQAHEHQDQVALLRQLARSEAPATSQAGLPTATSTPSPVLRIVLTILLLAALLTGLFFAETIAQLAPWAPPAGAPEAASLIDATAGETVLVAFEYTPALSGALDNDARAVLARLADNGSMAVLVSQSAAGATLAQQAASAVPDLQTADVGYIPGGAAGLRSLAQCLDDGRPCDSLFGRPLSPDHSAALSDAALIIVLSGDRGQLIDWVEQVQTATGTSMLAFVTEAIAPVAAPYESSRQLTAVSSNGSASLAPATQPLSPQDAAMLLGRWLAAATILLGAIYYLVTGNRSKKADVVR